MFTNKERQKQRTGRYGSSREEYLQELVMEFQKTTDEDSKKEILAHLANFGYDPFNYEIFRQLHIIDLFLDCLTEPCTEMVEYGIAGICNCSPDPENATIIVRNDGVPLIIACLLGPGGKSVLYALTALYYLCTPSTRSDILVQSVVERINQFAENSSTEIQLRNTAAAFLEKHVLA